MTPRRENRCTVREACPGDSARTVCCEGTAPADAARQTQRGTVRAMTARSFALTPGKRVLYLTKDPDKIRQQLAGTLRLTMNDVAPAELLDDINTDAMTPAWVCFDYDPAQIARNAYAGLAGAGQRD